MQKNSQTTSPAENWAANVKSMNKLRTFLCDAVRVKGHTGVQVDICRTCESQCAYGREYVKRYDAGERPAKPGPKPKAEVKDTMKETGLEKELADMRGREDAAQDVIKHLRIQLEQQETQLAEARHQNELDSALIEAAREQLEASDSALKCQEAELLKQREVNRSMADEIKMLQQIADEREQLNSDLQKAIANMCETARARQQETEALKEAFRQSEEKLHAGKLTVIRLKARLYDMEHPEEK